MGDFDSMESRLEILAVNTIHPMLQFLRGRWHCSAVCKGTRYTYDSVVSPSDALYGMMNQLPGTFGKDISEEAR